jgi:thiosulfate reductase/polysulfide reductase chain A
LYSTALEDEGFDPLPTYTAHPEPSDGFYRLNYGRAPMHTFSRTVNNPMLANIMDKNHVWMSPRVADLWGFSEGEEVRLKNQDGIVSSFTAPVRITERMGDDNIYMVHGFGTKDKRMKKSFGKGISDTELISNVMMDPIMGGTGMRGNFVTFVNKEREEVIV